MKVVIERETNKALYLFEDGDSATIQDGGLMFTRKSSGNLGGRSGRANDINAEDHRLIAGVPRPEDQGIQWMGSIIAYSSGNNEWSILNQEVYDARLAEEEELRVSNRLTISAAECSRRIFEKASANRQMNLASAASAGLMDETAMGLWRLALGWVASMRATWQPLAAGVDDIHNDANWPDLPAGVQDLLDQF